MKIGPEPGLPSWFASFVVAVERGLEAGADVGEIWLTASGELPVEAEAWRDPKGQSALAMVSKLVETTRPLAAAPIDICHQYVEVLVEARRHEVSQPSAIRPESRQ